MLASFETAVARATLNQFADVDGCLQNVQFEQLAEQTADVSEQLNHLLRLGIDQGLLLETEQGWQLTDASDAFSAELIWNTLARDYPEYFSLVLPAGRAGFQLAARLRGEKIAQSASTAELYASLSARIQGDDGTQVLAQELNRLLETQIRQLPPGQRLRVLEVAKRKFGLAEQLCSVIDSRVCDYSLAADSELQLDQAAQLQQRFPLLQTRSLQQAEDNAPRQDLVLVDLCGFTLQQGAELFIQLQAQLAPGAQLLLVGQHRSGWMDLLFGSSAQWWLAADAGDLAGSGVSSFETRGSDAGGSETIDPETISTDTIGPETTGSEAIGSDRAEFEAARPPASLEQWQLQLQSQGVLEIGVHRLGSSEQVGSYLLSARAPSMLEATARAPAEPQSWLLLGSETAPSSAMLVQLESALKSAGQRVDIAIQPDQQTLEVWLSKGYSQVVHLADIAAADTDTLAGQVRRCGLATQLVNSCEQLAISPRCWLLTAAVGEIFSSDQGSLASDAGLGQMPPADAVLWGFGRTLMNEAGNLDVRLLDLPVSLAGLAPVVLDAPAILRSLLDELLVPSADTELVIGAKGERYAPRLRIEVAPLAVRVEQLAAAVDEARVDKAGVDEARADGSEVDEKGVRLGFSLPGQLRNLRWEHAQSQPPADDQIEVAVKATGLNFRDVMYCLGLLSDEAIENGFAGPTLGLEFSGIVTRIGAAISDFNVGDAVVGFGPASFSSKVLTRTNAVTAIPGHIGFEAAATIPCTFFTVYYALHHLARLQPGEKVLIHGAAGGVGIAAIQIAQWLGAEIYATAGSDEKRDFLRLMGVEHIYDSRSLSFAEQILAESADGRGVDVVLNSLAGEVINRNLRVLKPMGRFLELGKRDFYENTHIGLRPFRNNISYFGIDSDQVMQECPELTRRLFTEMMELFNQGVLHPLPYTCFDANHVEESFRYMQQAKQIGKVVVTYDQEIRDLVAVNTAAQPPALQLDVDASYLVTGGLGGFGLRTARWLVEKGARQLILISRSGAASEEARIAVEELQAMGVTVHAAACDVTDKQALQTLLEDCRQQLGPLKGVVHAATVIDDSLIRNLTSEQIERVLAPKVLGAQHLHELTRDAELDLFVLFSSATTLLGNPGQSCYVAANHWLEALAAQRRYLGLAVTCARWGAIDDVGFLARNEKIKDALQSRMGGDALNSTLALEVLEQMILTHSATLGVMELEWSALKRFLPTAESLKFREIALAADDADNTDEDHLDLEQLFAELSDAELSQAIAEMLAQELSRILLIPADRIDLNRSVYDIGLDSLMGVELMVAIEARFGVNIPVMVLSDAPTLVKLGDYLITKLKQGDVADTINPEPDQLEQMLSQHGVDEEGRKQLQVLAEPASPAGNTTRIIH